jgi:hypothetical protein
MARRGTGVRSPLALGRTQDADRRGRGGACQRGLAKPWASERRADLSPQPIADEPALHHVIRLDAARAGGAFLCRQVSVPRQQPLAAPPRSSRHRRPADRPSVCRRAGRCRGALHIPVSLSWTGASPDVARPYHGIAVASNVSPMSSASMAPATELEEQLRRRWCSRRQQRYPPTQATDLWSPTLAHLEAPCRRAVEPRRAGDPWFETRCAQLRKPCRRRSLLRHEEPCGQDCRSLPRFPTKRRSRGLCV